MFVPYNGQQVDYKCKRNILHISMLSAQYYLRLAY